MNRRLVALISAVILLSPAGVLAYNPSFTDVCSDPNLVNTSTGSADPSICNTNTTDNPVSGSKGVIMKVSTTIALIAGVAAIVVIIIGSIRLTTSGGNPQKTASARSAVIGALIGLFIIAAAQTIIYLIISKLQQ